MKAHKPDKWEFYKDAAGEWRWTRTSPNGNVVGASTQGYKRIGNCKKNAVRNGAPADPEPVK